MKIGLDYWNVCSHHPDYFRTLATLALAARHEVHVISAVGQHHAGTVATEVAALGIPVTAVHEVLFERPSQSPALKRIKAQQLGLDVFYDDRDDVCQAMTENGILALRVTRARPGTRTRRRGDDRRGDLGAERK